MTSLVAPTVITVDSQPRLPWTMPIEVLGEV